MSRKKASKSPSTVGQVDVFGKIQGLDKLVNKPSVIEYDGLRVIHVMVSEADKKTPGYTEEALKLARALVPETVSRSKPPWMNAEWQAKRRMQRAGN